MLFVATAYVWTLVEDANDVGISNGNGDPDLTTWEISIRLVENDSDRTIRLTIEMGCLKNNSKVYMNSYPLPQ